MRELKKMLSSRGFCITSVRWGSPLSFTGEYSNGLPIVKKFDGDQFFGITQQTVIDVDNVRYGFCEIVAGGVIDIVQKGTVRIQKKLFINPKKIDFNKYVRPHKNGWKIQKKRNKNSIGITSLVSDSIIEMSLL